MRIVQVQDISFVIGWQRGYGCLKEDALTKVKPVPETPTKEFCDSQFPAIDALIKTPVAFAVLAPHGWSGEKCWYDYARMVDYGWEPLFWKESTHNDRTFIQFYRRTLDRAELPDRPAPGAKLGAMYDHAYASGSDLPNLGCSSILQAVDTPKADFLPEYPKMYAGCDPGKCLHFVRVARPLKLKTVATLRKQGFTRVACLKWNQYWVKGREGFGTKELCEY